LIDFKPISKKWIWCPVSEQSVIEGKLQIVRNKSASYQQKSKYTRNDSLSNNNRFVNTWKYNDHKQESSVYPVMLNIMYLLFGTYINVSIFIVMNSYLFRDSCDKKLGFKVLFKLFFLTYLMFLGMCATYITDRHV
jgi:hypothetical protein